MSINSGHRVEVVPVELRKHPNADSLSVVPIYGYTYVARTADWTGVTRGAWIPPDNTVDVRRPEFAFLAETAKDGRARIKARKLRGIVSYGLMVPVPDDTPLGEDWREKLGVEHYNPPEPGSAGSPRDKFFVGGEVAPAPVVYSPKYDVDSLLRYHHLFEEGEPTIVSEKIDGANARYVFHDGKMHCGSRTEWKKEYPSYEHVTVEGLVAKGVDPERAETIVANLKAKPRKKNLWWELLEKTPALEAFCRTHPDMVVYGEIFGNTNAIKYGLPEGNRFAAFDILHDSCWLDFQEALDLAVPAGLPWVPILAHIPYNLEAIKALAEGPTTVPEAKPGTIREGVVVRPLKERQDPHLGRVCLKCVSVAYLEK